MNAQPSREQSLWVQRLLVKPEWTYPETLLWVTFLDAEKVGAHLAYGASALVTERLDVAQAACRLLAREPGAVEAEPAAALEVALISGDVLAVADFPDRSNGASPLALKSADWQYLSFRGGQWLPSGGAVVDERRWRGAGYSDGIFINPRFIRETVMAAFRRQVGDGPQLRLVSDTQPPADASQTQPPPPKLGRSLRAYLVADDVCQVAAARVTTRGGDPDAEDELRLELRAMLQELKWVSADGSLDAIRRGAGFHIQRD